MNIPESMSVAFEREAKLSLASLQLTTITIADHAEYVREASDTYRFDLSITARPRDTSACYRERWLRSRFAPVGNVFVLPPSEVVQIKTSGATTQRSLACQLRPERVREWLGEDLTWSDSHLESSLDIRDELLRSTLAHLATELENPGMATNVMLESLLGQLTVSLGRYCTTHAQRRVKSGLAAWRLRLIDERLEKSATPTLNELAELCRLSVGAMTRGFRSSMGTSLGEYVARAELHRAKHLLREGASVKSVAFTLGFASSASFCAAFHRLAGETPGQFRQRLARH